jgi:hypothetical protein
MMRFVKDKQTGKDENFNLKFLILLLVSKMHLPQDQNIQYPYIIWKGFELNDFHLNDPFSCLKLNLEKSFSYKILKANEESINKVGQMIVLSKDIS